MEFFGINWVGLNAENGKKLLLSLAFIAAVLGTSAALRWIAGLAMGRSDHDSVQTKFWTRQGVSLIATVVLIIGLLSTWFNDPTNLSTAFGLMSAGLAFALQQVITSIAGLRDPARFDLHGRRSYFDGRRARRCSAPGIHPDDDHGDGSAATGAGRRPGDVGQESTVHRPHCHGDQLEDLCRAGF